MPQSNKTRCPSLSFTPEEWERLQCRLSIAPIEISGFGRIRSIGQLFLVDETILPKQMGSAGETVMDEMALASFVQELFDNDEDPSEWKLWWHSHAKMTLFWSSTDENTIEQLLATSQFLFSLVGNQRGEVLARLDIKTPRVTFDNVPITVSYTQSEMYEECADEFRSNVKQPRVRVRKTKTSTTTPLATGDFPLDEIDEEENDGRSDADYEREYQLLAPA